MNQEAVMVEFLFLLSWLKKSVPFFSPSKINAQAMRQANSLFSFLWWQEQGDFCEETKYLFVQNQC